ncbi:hypothetical protein RRG08_031105 [Elysia crispata]|uniref:Uncharacterized protein n=1 Tax=Elysia crispata TaxID=231223 RepID=A0AAE1DG71_9GAST|nr:hypothetical protein RRG08_031105 [Elysia crispata]
MKYRSVSISRAFHVVYYKRARLRDQDEGLYKEMITLPLGKGSVFFSTLSSKLTNSIWVGRVSAIGNVLIAFLRMVVEKTRRTLWIKELRRSQRGCICVCDCACECECVHEGKSEMRRECEGRWRPKEYCGKSIEDRVNK